MAEEARRFQYGGYIVEPRSDQVREGPNNPAGWVPKVWLERHEGGSVETFPISLPRSLRHLLAQSSCRVSVSFVVSAPSPGDAVGSASGVARNPESAPRRMPTSFWLSLYAF